MIANAIIPLDETAALQAVTTLHNIVMRLRRDQFIEGVDYGKIPGTNDKPVLLLPGIEKLMRSLNAVPVYSEKHVIRDFDKPLFYFEYECRLVDADSGVAIPGGLAIGLATSYESKWRWRKAERTCPNCGKANIRKSKDKPEYYCWVKTDGCGAVFKDTDPAIINQVVGRVENTDIFDQINTICKIAQKRALSSAIKGAAAVSEFFTVDLEDYSDQVITVTPEIIEEKPATPKASNVTDIEVARQNLGSGSVERRAPYDKPKVVTDGTSAIAPVPEKTEKSDNGTHAPKPSGDVPKDPKPSENSSAGSLQASWQYDYQSLMKHPDVTVLYPRGEHRANVLALLERSKAFEDLLDMRAAVARVQRFHKLTKELKATDEDAIATILTEPSF